MYLTAHCANCDAELIDGDRFCKKCGHSVVPSECSHCGESLSSESSFCASCGESVTVATVPTNVGGVAPEPVRRTPTLADFSVQNALDRKLLGYRNPRRRANWTIGLLIAGIVMAASSIVVTTSENELIDRVLSGESVSDEEIEDNDSAVIGVALMAMAIYVATVIAFAMWIHRASSNLEPLNAQGQRFSPGWAVGWWFIPIMQVWRPYQVVKEIWNGSDPYYVGERARNWKEAPVWGWLGWWWAIWIIASIAGTVSARETWSAETLEEIREAHGAVYFAEFTFIAVSVLAIFLVKVISNRQERKFDAI